MLKFLRKKENQKRIYIVLALVIIPPFVLWGVFLQKNEKGPSTLGVIEGKKISLQDYLKSYQAVEHQAVLVYGEKLAQLRPFINFKGEAWDRLLLLDYAKKEGLRTSDDEVVNWVTHQPVFMGKKGDFDADFYKLYIGQFLRTSTRAFEEEVRQFLTIQKIRRRFESNEALGKLLDKLRRELKINLETFRNLFPEGQEEKSAPTNRHPRARHQNVGGSANALWRKGGDHPVDPR